MVSPFRTGLIPPGLNRGFQSLVTSAFSFRFIVSVCERHPRLSGLWLAPSGIGPPGPKARRRPPQSRTSAINASGSSRLRIRPQGYLPPSVNTLIRAQSPRCVSGHRSVVPTSSFATRGLLWVSYPAFHRYYEDTKTASARLSHLRIPLGVRYPGCFRFLGDHGRKARSRSWTLLSRCGPLPALSEETGGSPSFPEDPITALPCSQTPGGPPHQTIAVLRCCPRFS
jgi:hypothetical protein